MLVMCLQTPTNATVRCNNRLPPYNDHTRQRAQRHCYLGRWQRRLRPMAATRTAAMASNGQTHNWEKHSQCKEVHESNKPHTRTMQSCTNALELVLNVISWSRYHKSFFMILLAARFELSQRCANRKRPCCDRASTSISRSSSIHLSTANSNDAHSGVGVGTSYVKIGSLIFLTAQNMASRTQLRCLHQLKQPTTPVHSTLTRGKTHRLS